MKRTLDITMRGGAVNRQRMTITTEIDEDDEWPPRAIQLDMHDARWTYARVQGERTADGEYIFELTQRERADMVADYGEPPEDATLGKAKWPWGWFG